MAIRPCKECGQQVSSKADHCPHCGFRVGPKQYGCISGIVIVLLSLFILGKVGEISDMATTPLGRHTQPRSSQSYTYQETPKPVGPPEAPEILVPSEVAMDVLSRKVNEELGVYRSSLNERPPLHLIASTHKRREGYRFVQGIVENWTLKLLDVTETFAVVEFWDTDGNLVKNAKSPLEGIGPDVKFFVDPGKLAKFTVVIAENYDCVFHTLRFEDKAGNPIEYEKHRTIRTLSDRSRFEGSEQSEEAPPDGPTSEEDPFAGSL